MSSIFNRTASPALALLLIVTISCVSQTCPVPGSPTNNITMQVDNGVTTGPNASEPLRRQVLQLGDTVYWHQPDDYQHTKVFIYFIGNNSPCAPSGQPGPPSDPTHGTCTIRPQIPVNAPTKYQYEYCVTDLTSDPRNNCATIAKHDILVEPSEAASPNKADLELNVDDVSNPKEVSHFVRNVDTCIYWQNPQSQPTAVTFIDKIPNKATKCARVPNGGVISCFVKATTPRYRHPYHYKICDPNGCTDPTIHILGSDDPTLMDNDPRPPSPSRPPYPPYPPMSPVHAPSPPKDISKFLYIAVLLLAIIFASVLLMRRRARAKAQETGDHLTNRE